MTDLASRLVHRYFVSPYLPIGLNVTASFIPVTYLLLYQYCTNRKRNFLLYSLPLSAALAFGLGPLEQSVGLVELGKGMNFFHLFLMDVAISYIAYGMTKLVLYFHRTGKETRN